MTTLPPEGPSPDAWYRTAFGRHYLTVYRGRDEEDARKLGRLLSELHCDLPGRSVLDIGCGPGRHLRVLEGAGAEAFGIDLSADLLAEARRRGRAARIARADMRTLPFRDRAFDLALLLFTTFGYFETDEEHARVLTETRRVLRPGGRLVIDTLNSVRLRSILVPETRRRVGAVTVTERRWIDDARSRIHKNVEVTDPDDPEGPGRWTESVRLWTDDELRDLLARSGFDVLRLSGGFGGEAFSAETSERLILLSEVRE
jgi:SAM-dependent methyltransferase